MQRKVIVRDLMKGTVTDADLADVRARLTPAAKSLSPVALDQTVIRGLLDFQAAGKVWEQEAKSLYPILDMNLADAEAYIQEHPPSAGAIALLLHKSLQAYKSDLARRNGAKKFSKSRRDEVKAHVLAEWQKNDGSYNKSTFGVWASGQVLQLFEFEITPGQISRYWLPK